MIKKKLLIVDVAALGWNLVSPNDELYFHKMETVFPAVTSTAQASFRTASPPSDHGLISNGLFFRDLRKVLFWEQSSALVEGRRIWENFRAQGGRVGLMFWQQSLGESVDLLLSPAPIHKHGDGMIQDCYGEPADLYERLQKKIGRKFNLMHYWGPLASHRSTDWIVDATCAVMEMPDIAPELLMTYLPHLDYDLQRFGPESAKAQKALALLMKHLQRLKNAAEKNGYEFLFFGDYAIESVTRGAAYPNQCLRDAGLFQTRRIRKMDYPDFFASRAFAVVDHEVAHVYVHDQCDLATAQSALEKMAGVEKVLDRKSQQQIGLDHPRGGELVLIAKPGTWFAYPWWKEKRHAPDYASHVDIHNKPGYDPCELFFGWPPPGVSFDTKRIRGSHGRPGVPAAWASSCQFATEPQTLIELAKAVEQWLAA